jgi:putative transposase
MSAILSPPEHPARDGGTRRVAPRSAPGQTHVIVVATLYRRAVFTDDEAARAACRMLSAAWPWRDARLLAWVLMPDEWQGLVTLGERDSLSTLMGRFKAITSRAVEDRHRVNGWLWGRGFRDRLLRVDEDPVQVARELVGAPLRAGLVQRIGDYAYWDAAWLFPEDDRVA